MAVTTTNRTAGPFLGNGVATVFPFSFKVFIPDDVLVVVDVSGVFVPLVLGVDYTVTLNADQDVAAGGAVTLGGALAAGTRMIITSDIAELQQVILTNLGGFFPDTLNTVFDRLTILCQQLDDKVSRSLKLGMTDDLGGTTLPGPTLRAGKYLAFDAFGAPSVIAQSPISIGGSIDLSYQATGMLPPANGGSGVGSPMAFGAKGDGVTVDTQAFKNAAAIARSTSKTLYLPPGKYVLDDSIDFRGLRVTGAGPYQTLLAMKTGTKKSVVLISLNTQVCHFGIDGGWDGTTIGASGYGIEATSTDPSVAQLAYHMLIHNISIQNTYASNIYLRNAAYTLISNCDCHNAAGRASCDIDSADYPGGSPPLDGFGSTTITLFHNTFSDTAGANAPAIFANDVVNLRVIANVSENTTGYKVAGPQNRAHLYDGNYQENTTGNKFIDFSGSSGIGLTMTGNRAGPIAGPTVADLVLWGSWSIRGNWFSAPDIGDSGFATTLRATSAFFDPLGTQPGEFVINPNAQTTLSPAMYSPGASWAVILKGTFVDFTGGVTAVPPLMVATSGAPSLVIGHTTVTFSISGTGAFQATVSAYNSGATTVRFLGWVEVYADRNHAGSPYAMQSGAPILVGGVQSGGAVNAATLSAANGYNGPLPAGKVPVFTNGICTGVQ